jgi:hypothetical protein
VKYFALTPIDLQNIPIDARPTMMGDTKGIVARDENGKAAAICTIDSWSPNSCQMHLWIDNPMVLRRGFREEVFGFVFGKESGRQKVICVMAANNVKVVSFNKKMGFTELLRIKDGFDVGIDYVVTELNKQDCRYIDHG